MSIVGGIVGIQEGIEGGLVTGGLTVGEQHPQKVIALGLGAVAAGVLIGNKVGEGSLELIDQFVGDGGIGFVPALAIGSSVWWHNARANAPSQSAGITEKLSLAAGAAFAAFEGIEAGILTASSHTNLLTSEITTVGAAAVTTAAFGGIKVFANKLSPAHALTAARGIALLPAAYLGAKASPELLESPKAAGVGIAALGVVAVGGALRSFFKTKRAENQESID